VLLPVRYSVVKDLGYFLENHQAFPPAAFTLCRLHHSGCAALSAGCVGLF
jgi:hypothetical protein